MKASLKVTGVVELDETEVAQALKLVVLKRATDILSAVTAVVKEKTGYIPTKIQKDEDLSKIVAFIDQDVDQGGGARPIGKGPRSPINRSSNAGFDRRWTGFYRTAKEVFDEEKAKKRHTLSFMDFYNKLLDFDDVRTGGKLFIKKNHVTGEMEPIEMTRVKQYLSPSQLKKTPQMKGIKWDDKNQEFRF